jgi:hypothetical protein
MARSLDRTSFAGDVRNAGNTAQSGYALPKALPSAIFFAVLGFIHGIPVAERPGLSGYRELPIVNRGGTKNCSTQGSTSRNEDRAQHWAPLRSGTRDPPRGGRVLCPARRKRKKGQICNDDAPRCSLLHCQARHSPLLAGWPRISLLFGCVQLRLDERAHR